MTSRLEKIGTIFSRTSGLLRSEAMKLEDKPLWYDIYEKFPPKYNPKFDRPAPNIELRPIFYPEDNVRAKYHKTIRNTTSVTLTDRVSKTRCQKFIDVYQQLAAQGAISDQQTFDTALEVVNEQHEQDKSKYEQNETVSPGLVSSFVEANQQNVKQIQIADIFKD